MPPRPPISVPVTRLLPLAVTIVDGVVSVPPVATILTVPPCAVPICASALAVSPSVCVSNAVALLMFTETLPPVAVPLDMPSFAVEAVGPVASPPPLLLPRIIAFADIVTVLATRAAPFDALSSAVPPVAVPAFAPAPPCATATTPAMLIVEFTVAPSTVIREVPPRLLPPLPSIPLRPLPPRPPKLLVVNNAIGDVIAPAVCVKIAEPVLSALPPLPPSAPLPPLPPTASAAMARLAIFVEAMFVAGADAVTLAVPALPLPPAPPLPSAPYPLLIALPPLPPEPRVLSAMFPKSIWLLTRLSVAVPPIAEPPTPPSAPLLAPPSPPDASEFTLRSTAKRGVLG